jgi:hypothetical protein
MLEIEMEFQFLITIIFGEQLCQTTFLETNSLEAVRVSTIRIDSRSKELY